MVFWNTAFLLLSTRGLPGGQGVGGDNRRFVSCLVGVSDAWEEKITLDSTASPTSKFHSGPLVCSHWMWSRLERSNKVTTTNEQALRWFLRRCEEDEARERLGS